MVHFLFFFSFLSKSPAFSFCTESCNHVAAPACKKEEGRARASLWQAQKWGPALWLCYGFSLSDVTSLSCPLPLWLLLLSSSWAPCLLSWRDHTYTDARAHPLFLGPVVDLATSKGHRDLWTFSVYLFIYSFAKHILRTCNMPGTVLCQLLWIELCPFKIHILKP